MIKRPARSILLIAGTELARGDFFRRSVKPAQFVRHSVESTVEWTLVLDHPALTRSPYGRRVTILTTGVDTHLIGFPAASVAQMNEVELTNALRFEIETLSGIEIEDLAISSVLAESPDSETQKFFVSYVRRSTLDRVQRHLGMAGVRNFQVVHPAGFGLFRRYTRELPTLANEHVERWGGELFRYSRDSRKLKEILRITPTVIESTRGQIALGIGLESEAGEKHLTPAMDLREPAAMQRWMAGVVHTLGISRNSFPVIAPVRRETVIAWRPLVSLALAALVIVGCWMHRSWLIGHIDQVGEQTVAIGEPGKLKLRNEGELQKLLEQQSGLDLETAGVLSDLKRVRTYFDLQNSRLAELFKLLGQLRTSDLVVREMGTDPEGMILSGISLNSDAAPLFANRLRAFVLPLGWNVVAATQEGQQKLVSGGPWNFQVLLRNNGPFQTGSQESEGTLQQTGNKNTMNELADVKK